MSKKQEKITFIIIFVIACVVVLWQLSAIFEVLTRALVGAIALVVAWYSGVKLFGKNGLVR